MKFVFVNLNSIILYLYLFNLIFLYVLIVYNKKLLVYFFKILYVLLVHNNKYLVTFFLIYNVNSLIINIIYK